MFEIPYMLFWTFIQIITIPNEEYFFWNNRRAHRHKLFKIYIINLWSPLSFEQVSYFICGNRRVAVTRLQMMCLIPSNIIPNNCKYFNVLTMRFVSFLCPMVKWSGRIVFAGSVCLKVCLFVCLLSILTFAITFELYEIENSYLACLLH